MAHECFFDHSKHGQHDFVDRHTSKPHFCCVGFCIFVTIFAARCYFLVAGVGPNECWPFVEYHHYNFVTNPSKHDFVDRHTSKPLFFSMFFGCFLDIFRSLSTNKSSAWLFFGGRRGSKRVLAFCRVSSLQLRHNFVTNPSKHDFVDRHTSKPSFFSMFLVGFLEIFTSFFDKKSSIWPRSRPRWPKMAHDGSRWPEVVPKMAPRRLKMARDGSRWSQDGFKLAPRLPKMAPRRPKMAPTWLKMAQSGPRLPRSARERIRRPLNAGAWLAEAVNETRRPQNAGAQPGNEPDARRTQAPGETRRPRSAGAWLAQPGNEPDDRRTQALSQGTNHMPEERTRLARSAREPTRRQHNPGDRLEPAVN